jgi:hypothetical protein|eukprot:6374342-Prymnesium_polylepis.1
MSRQVTIRTSAGEEVHVREAVLCACSPVLDGILSDSDTAKPRVLSMPCSLEELNAFVSLATSLAYDEGSKPMTANEVARTAYLTVPLIHKYDTSGMYRAVVLALNEHPHILGLLAVARCEESAEWVGDKALQCPINTLCPDTSWTMAHYGRKSEKVSITPGKLNDVEKEQEAVLELLPHALLRKLIVNVGRKWPMQAQSNQFTTWANDVDFAPDTRCSFDSAMHYLSSVAKYVQEAKP